MLHRQQKKYGPNLINEMLCTFHMKHFEKNMRSVVNKNSVNRKYRIHGLQPAPSGDHIVAPPDGKLYPLQPKLLIFWRAGSFFTDCQFGIFKLLLILREDWLHTVVPIYPAPTSKQKVP